MSGDFNTENVFENLNRCLQLAKKVKISDLINPTSKQIGEVAELLYRLQHCPHFEILNNEGFEA